MIQQNDRGPLHFKHYLELGRRCQIIRRHKPTIFLVYLFYSNHASAGIYAHPLAMAGARDGLGLLGVCPYVNCPVIYLRMQL